jgi:hypothetical protein
LEERVNTLLNILAEHNIPVPPETPHSAAAPASTVHVVVGTQENPSAAHVDLSFAPAASGPMEIVPRALPSSNHAPRPGTLSNPGADFSIQYMQQTPLLDPRVGINFILA